MICVTTFFWMGSSRVNAADVVDRIVAVVNDDIISLYEWNQAFIPISKRIEEAPYSTEQQQQLMANVRRQLLDQLIEQKLTDQQLKRHNIEVSDQEVDFAIEQLKENQSMDDETFQRALESENLTLDLFRQKIKNQILRSKLVNLEIRSKIVITGEEIEAYYKAHLKEFGGKKTYFLRNLVIIAPRYATDDDLRFIETQMQEIKQKLAEGQSFAELARQYSQGPTAADGGELGGFELEELSQQLQVEVGKLQAGQSTPVLKTDFGYQIVYVDRIDEKAARSLQDVQDQIIDKLSRDVINDKYQEWLEDLKERSHIRIMN